MAWIQPGYTPNGEIYPDRFGNNYGIQGGSVKEMQTYAGELYLVGTFSHIDSFPANLIAAWDGENTRSFPGLAGVVDHIAIDENNGDIYVSGQFYTFNEEPGIVFFGPSRLPQSGPGYAPLRPCGLLLSSAGYYPLS